MNIDKNELSRLSIMPSEEELKSMFIIPEELEEEANGLLGDKEKVKVDMTKDTPLIRWAKDKKKQKAKRKMVEASRKRNRG
jgi:hypothetical protein